VKIQPDIERLPQAGQNQSGDDGSLKIFDADSAPGHQ
jgi:hypothetical protein